MKAKTILVFAIVLSIQAVAQHLAQPQTQAECKFPDGKMMTVTYSSTIQTYRWRPCDGEGDNFACRRLFSCSQIRVARRVGVNSQQAGSEKSR